MSFFWLYLLKFVFLYNTSCVGSLFLPLCFSSIYLQFFFMTCGLWLVVWHFQRQLKFNRVMDSMVVKFGGCLEENVPYANGNCCL